MSEDRDTDEIASLRSALIEALWDSGRHGCGLDECTDTVACPACRADLGADVDAMLNALGLEQVGWRSRAGKLHQHDVALASDEPVYRLRALSTEGASDG
jgi:hypothetical protein